MTKFPFDYDPWVLGLDHRLLEEASEQARAFDSAAKALEMFRPLDIGPTLAKAVEHLQALTQAFSPSVEELAAMSQASQALMDPVRHLAEAVQNAQEMFAPIRQLQDSFARSVDFAQLASGALGSLDIGAIGAALDLHGQHQESLARHLSQLTRSFEGVYEHLHSARALQVPSFVIDRPPKELYIHTGLLESITTRLATPEVAPAPPERYDELVEETQSILHEQLETLSRSLIVIWRGAREALASRNPDRVRHACSSLRELLTQALHILSPDVEIERWSKSEKDFDKGRPTRNARLRYMCRHVDQGRFARFLRVDIASAEEILDLLQKGVHAPESGFSVHQVKLIALRADHLLLFMFEVARLQAS